MTNVCMIAYSKTRWWMPISWMVYADGDLNAELQNCCGHPCPLELSGCHRACPSAPPLSGSDPGGLELRIRIGILIAYAP